MGARLDLTQFAYLLTKYRAEQTPSILAIPYILSAIKMTHVSLSQWQRKSIRQMLPLTKWGGHQISF